MQIFLKKNAFFGEKEVFFCFFGVAVVRSEGDRDYRDYRDYRGYSLAFLFLAAGGQASPKGHCFFAAFSFVSLPSFCRPFAVFLPSLFRD